MVPSLRRGLDWPYYLYYYIDILGCCCGEAIHVCVESTWWAHVGRCFVLLRLQSRSLDCLRYMWGVNRGKGGYCLRHLAIAWSKLYLIGGIMYTGRWSRFRSRLLGLLPSALAWWSLNKRSPCQIIYRSVIGCFCRGSRNVNVKVSGRRWEGALLLLCSCHNTIIRTALFQSSCGRR